MAVNVVYGERALSSEAGSVPMTGAFFVPWPRFGMSELHGDSPRPVRVTLRSPEN